MSEQRDDSVNGESGRLRELAVMKSEASWSAKMLNRASTDKGVAGLVESWWPLTHSKEKSGIFVERYVRYISSVRSQSGFRQVLGYETE
jgi:hypothetical protein